MPEVPLPGCTPEPLMDYLKALGVFRLVAEQSDPQATMCWKGGIAHLTSKLDRDALVSFFRDEYKPTPIVGPWGARSGFYPGSSESSARDALNEIESSSKSNPRLKDFASMIAGVRTVLNRLGFTEKVKDDDKLSLMRECRNALPDELIPWLDTAFIITEDWRKFPPLLGTGGNEGSGSYVSTFAQAVVSLIVRQANPEGIGSALFGDFNSKLGGLAVGHFDPGALGGPNGSQGFGGGGGVNPWDYLLGIEGSLVFAGASSRRFGTETSSKASYPFCVEPIAVGYASESDKEAGEQTRSELWLPLWSEPASLPEVNQLFAEGRAQLGRRQARNAVEFALSLSALGVSRGLSAFVRYAFVMRYGLSYFAAPLGRVTVTPRPKARLLDDPALVSWLDQLRRGRRQKDKPPTRYRAPLRHIGRAIYPLANRSEHGNDAKYLADVLVALGNAERILAGGLRFAQEKYIRPLQGLSAQWLEAADDGTAEFRLAAALAGIAATKKREIGPLRAHLEEVEVTKFVTWSPGSKSAVWSKQPLAANLAAVFRRRRMEAFRNGGAGVPIPSRRPARLDDVLAFLRDETDDEKLADLLWALTAIDWRRVKWAKPERSHESVPVEFGLQRLLVNPLCWSADRRNPERPRWTVDKGEANAKHDPDVFHALAAGDTNEAITKAARRLRSGGLTVNGYRNRQRAGREITVQTIIEPERLLAAMLIPISTRDLVRIANTVLYPPEPQE